MTFKVRGAGAFPFDMLRYDLCYPHTEVDAALLSETRMRTITLESMHAGSPTTARWMSFNWSVLKAWQADEPPPQKAGRVEALHARQQESYATQPAKLLDYPPLPSCCDTWPYGMVRVMYAFVDADRAQYIGTKGK